MNNPDPDLSRVTSEYLQAWLGYGLPEDVARRSGPDFARLMRAFQDLSPPPFDLQVHHFAPLLEALADD
jgi:hypothetical protein